MKAQFSGSPATLSSMRGSRHRWAWGACAATGAAVVIACGLDVTGTGAAAVVPEGDATPATTTTTAPTTTTTTPPIADSGSDDLFDGGGNLDFGDGGEGGDDFEPSDASPDGGVCAVPLLAGNFIDDTCCRKAGCRSYLGGTLVDGTYGLNEIAAIGNGEFCANAYVGLEHDAELVISTDSTTRFLGFHEIVRSTAGGQRRNVGLYQVETAALSNELTLTAVCPGSAVSEKWTYQTTDSGVILRRQFGNAIFRYTFVRK